MIETQQGGLPKRGVDTAPHTTKSLLGVTRKRTASASVTCIDLASAFYEVVKEIAMPIRDSDGDGDSLLESVNSRGPSRTF